VSAIAPDEDYILGRWEQGAATTQSGSGRRSTEQGYPGVCCQNVVRITRYPKEEQECLGKPAPPDRPPGISASHAAGILAKR